MQAYYIKILFGFILSFLTTFYLIPFVIKIAKKLKILDIPDGVIKQHKEPTPYLGGIAIYVGFIVALGFVFPFQNHMLLFFIGITLLLFIGLIDDLITLKPYQKFFGQMISAFCFMKSGLLLKTEFFLYHLSLIPFSILWILTVINAFNLIDVMDGLASLVAIFATATFMIIALLWQEYYNAIFLSSFLGALIAFFCHNRPPAKIYLGDTGSLLIGGVLATIPFVFNWSIYNPHGFIVPLIILAIPLLEVVTLIVIRTAKGIPFYKPSPDHFSLYLLRIGWSKYIILSYVVVLSAILGGTSVLFMSNMLSTVTVSILGGFFILNWISIFATNQEK